jgi:hypothetical protein
MLGATARQGKSPGGTLPEDTVVARRPCGAHDVALPTSSGGYRRLGVLKLRSGGEGGECSRNPGYLWALLEVDGQHPPGGSRPAPVVRVPCTRSDELQYWPCIRGRQSTRGVPPRMSDALASNSRGRSSEADEIQRADRRIQGIHGRRPTRSMRWDPRCGAVRGTSSFHEGASDVVHGANAAICAGRTRCPR